MLVYNVGEIEYSPSSTGGLETQFLKMRKTFIVPSLVNNVDLMWFVKLGNVFQEM